MTIDLDALRAARLEAAGESPTVVFGGVTFALPPELPFEVAEYAAILTDEDVTDAASVSAIKGCFRELLDEQYDAFMALRPSKEDVDALFGAVMDLYGTSPGEPAASES